MNKVELKVNGKIFEGWKRVRVTLSIETIAGSFELEVSDRWANQPTLWPILEEDSCELAIDGMTVITGYVDRRTLSYSASDRSLSVSGRDRTGSLVDCSAQLEKWEFKNTSVLTVAKRIASDFNIEVKAQGGLVLPNAPAKISIDPGDTCHEAIERACRLAGVLPVSDGLGNLVLTRAGSAQASVDLVEGENILSASAEYDSTGRHYLYAVLGQHKGSDQLNGASTSIKATATDENVKRVTRTLLIRPEGNVTPEHAKKRAQWEATVRAARSETVSVTVQGWTQGGALWPVNGLVKVRSPMIGVNGTMLITQATFGLDASNGLTTQLTLRRPDAFLPEPVVTKAKTSGWKELAGGA